MNWFDIIVAVLLLWAAWRGYSTGFIRQAISLAALALGVWLAFAFGPQVGIMLGVDALLAPLVGFIVVFLVVVVVLVILGMVTKGLFRLMGLGALDSIFGVVLSLLKTWIILSLLCSWLAAWSKVDGPQAVGGAISSSRLYPAFVKTADYIFPMVELAKEQLAPSSVADNQNQTE